MVPEAGFEPARDFSHCPLKTACLPIPPLGLDVAGSIVRVSIHSTCVGQRTARIRRNRRGAGQKWQASSAGWRA